MIHAAKGHEKRARSFLHEIWAPTDTREQPFCTGSHLFLQIVLCKMNGFRVAVGSPLSGAYV